MQPTDLAARLGGCPQPTSRPLQIRPIQSVDTLVAVRANGNEVHQSFIPEILIRLVMKVHAASARRAAAVARLGHSARPVTFASPPPCGRAYVLPIPFRPRCPIRSSARRVERSSVAVPNRGARLDTLRTSSTNRPSFSGRCHEMTFRSVIPLVPQETDNSRRADRLDRGRSTAVAECSGATTRESRFQIASPLASHEPATYRLSIKT